MHTYLLVILFIDRVQRCQKKYQIYDEIIDIIFELKIKFFGVVNSVAVVLILFKRWHQSRFWPLIPSDVDFIKHDLLHPLIAQKLLFRYVLAVIPWLRCFSRTLICFENGLRLYCDLKIVSWSKNLWKPLFYIVKMEYQGPIPKYFISKPCT